MYWFVILLALISSAQASWSPWDIFNPREQEEMDSDSAVETEEEAKGE